MRRTRGQLLLMAQRKGKPLGPPPERFGPAELAAWNDIVAAAPPVFHWSDSIYLEMLSIALTSWRKGGLPNEWTRLMYRMLGDCFVPMRERRRLLFPDRVRA